MSQLQEFKRALILVFVFILVLPVSNAIAEEWSLFNDGKLVGSIPAINRKGNNYVAIGTMARALGCRPENLREGLLIRKGSNRLQIVPNAAAAWLDYEIVPLRTRAFVERERWWLDSDSALFAVEKLLLKSGQRASLSWQGGSAREISLPAKENKEVLKTAAPVSGVEKRLSGIIECRWGVYENKVRAVLEFSGGLPAVKSSKGRVIVGAVPVRGHIGKSPDPSIKVNLKKKGALREITFVTSGWRIQYFKLDNPGRLVVDFYRPESVKKTPYTHVKKPVTAPSVAVKNKKHLVVIDAGHGGKDPGACSNGFQEKKLALQIAKKIARQVEANGMKARLTRTGDSYLRLRTRTSLANKWNADAFVSVHLNALPRGRHAKGVEIYIMALPSDKDAMELAKIENAELVEDGSDSDGKSSLLLSILGDMQQNNKIRESTLFAESLYKAGKKGSLPMRRVAQAPFFVLRGAGMPAVLIETGFISEQSEARLLASPTYQEKLARYLARGIADYLK